MPREYQVNIVYLQGVAKNLDDGKFYGNTTAVNMLCRIALVERLEALVEATEANAKAIYNGQI